MTVTNIAVSWGEAYFTFSHSWSTPSTSASWPVALIMRYCDALLRFRSVLSMGGSSSIVVSSGGSGGSEREAMVMECGGRDVVFGGLVHQGAGQDFKGFPDAGQVIIVFDKMRCSKVTTQIP